MSILGVSHSTDLNPWYYLSPGGLSLAGISRIRLTNKQVLALLQELIIIGTALYLDLMLHTDFVLIKREIKALTIC